MSRTPKQSRPSWVIARTDLRQLLQARDFWLPLMVVALDGPELRIVATTGAYRAFAGRTEMIGLPVREAFPETLGQQIMEIFERTYACLLLARARPGVSLLPMPRPFSSCPTRYRSSCPLRYSKPSARTKQARTFWCADTMRSQQTALRSVLK